MDMQKRLLPHTLKPEEITGTAETKHLRVCELVRWMVRYNDGSANPKWLAAHATELAHYAAEVKGL